MKKIILISALLIIGYSIFAQRVETKQGNWTFTGYIEGQDSTQTPIAKMDIIKANTAWAVFVYDTLVLGNNSPATRQRFNVDGAIQIGTTTTGTAGAIRYTGSVFEGYTGGSWGSLGAGGGGISDADADSSFYIRNEQGWTAIKNMYNGYEKDASFDLVYWKDDFVEAVYENNSNANMAWLTDSYGSRYYERLRGILSDKLGYGGGYNTFYVDCPYATWNTIFIDATGDWTYGNDEADTYNPHSRFIYTTTNSEPLYLSTKRFNFIRIAFKTFTGSGDFTIQLGANGSVLQTVGSSSSDALKWASYYWDGETLGFPNDTVIIKKTTADSLVLYGFELGWKEYRTGIEHRPIAIHGFTHSGSTAGDWENKNHDAMTLFYDTLQPTLINLLFGANGTSKSTYYTQMDVLIDSLRLWQTGSSIAIIHPNDETNKRDSLKYDNAHKLAVDKNVAFINLFNRIGDVDTLDNAGLMDGSKVHLDGNAYYFPMMDLYDQIIYPYDESRVEELTIGGSKLYTEYDDNNYIWTNEKIDNTSTSSVFIGSDAGNSANSVGNIGIGYSAVKYTTANYNIGIGYNAVRGQSNCTGLANVGIGYAVMQNATSGRYNVCVGYLAGSGITTAQYNVFVGSGAGDAVTSGGSNVLIGRDAGNLLSTGTSNICIGRGAGNNNVSGVGNVMIGYNAGYSETTGGKLYIDNSNTTTPLIYGDFSANEITINGDFHATGTSTLFGEMYIANNSTAITVNTADQWQAVSTLMLEGEMNGFTYQVGTSGTDISAYADSSGTNTTVTTTGDHALSIGDYITIDGTTNYNDVHLITSSSSVRSFVIDHAYVADDATGNYNRGVSLTCDVGSGGIYKGQWNAGGQSADANQVFHFTPCKNTAPAAKALMPNKFSNADDAPFSGGALMDISDGDKIHFLIRNKTSAGNITLLTLNMNLLKL